MHTFSFYYPTIKVLHRPLKLHSFQYFLLALRTYQIKLNTTLKFLKCIFYLAIIVNTLLNKFIEKQKSKWRHTPIDWWNNILSHPIHTNQPFKLHGKHILFYCGIIMYAQFQITILQEPSYKLSKTFGSTAICMQMCLRTLVSPSVTSSKRIIAHRKGGSYIKCVIFININRGFANVYGC